MRGFKQWYEEEANSCAVQNCPSYREWFAQRDFTHSHYVLTDNRENFRNLFGKPNATYTSEFRYSVWIREFKGEKFILFTAGTKGTCIEICDCDFNSINDKNEVIIDFLEDLLEKLMEHEKESKCELD